jgi:hypothetical protein
MTGIALIASELPVSLLESVIHRLHDRGGCPEVRFENWHHPPLLPVRWDGALRLMQWGSRDRRSVLPYGGLLTRHQMESGLLAGVDEAVIPANQRSRRLGRSCRCGVRQRKRRRWRDSACISPRAAQESSGLCQPNEPQWGALRDRPGIFAHDRA